MARAWRKARQLGVERAARRWDECMWPWEDEPASEAEGILDDETYDWLGVVARWRATVARWSWRRRRPSSRPTSWG